MPKPARSKGVVCALTSCRLRHLPMSVNLKNWKITLFMSVCKSKKTNTILEIDKDL